MTKIGAVPSGIIIDSSFFGVDGPFVLYPASSSGLDQICPGYVHSAVDIRLGVVPGDAEGDGTVGVSDFVFLINYVFSGGLAPNPPTSGDADCSGYLSISDAVYLVRYIFAGGPPPCE